jgi:hypothetical protein
MTRRRFGDRLRQWKHSTARQLLLLLYPRTWRRRYGAEFAALLAHRRLTPHDILDVVRAALDEHRRGRQLAQGEREQSMARNTRGLACSFCGKSQQQAGRLIAGPNGIYICDACVGLCNEILAGGAHETPSQQPEGALPTGRRRARPWWQLMVNRWLPTRGKQHLQGAHL